MTETGKVTKIEGDVVTLLCAPGPVCGSCSRAGCCGSGGREVRARNPRRIPLKTGDEAEISLPPAAGLLSALKVFGIPILAFAVFYSIAGISGGWRESLCVAAGFAGLIPAGLVLFFAGRRNPAFPEILRSTESE
jgi:positive regulator of sigma E activity